MKRLICLQITDFNMAVGLYVNMDELNKDVEFEDYVPLEGWPNDEYEKSPQIDVKFMGRVSDFPQDIKETFKPPLGDNFSASEMEELAEDIEEVISKRELEDEKYREDINRVIDWLQYWSDKGVSCRKG